MALPVVSVILNRSYIHLAADLSQYIVFGTSGSQGGGGSRVETNTIDGSVRQYANNISRAVFGSATSKTMSVTCRAITQDQVKFIQANIGSNVLFRDSYGRAYWCTYFQTDTTDIPLSGLANADLLTDVTLSLAGISYTRVT